MSFAQNTTPTIPKQPQHGIVQLVNASGTTAQTLVTAGANGSKIVAIYASSTDTASHDVQIVITRGGTSYLIATASVGAGAGNTSGSPNQNLLNSAYLPVSTLAVDNDGQPYFFLLSGDTLQVIAVVAVTAAKAINIHCDYADF